MRTITIAGEVFLTAEVDKNPDGEDEVQAIKMIEIDFGKGLSVDLLMPGFYNFSGNSVAGVIFRKHDTLVEIIKAEEEKDRKLAEEAAEEEEYHRRRLE